MSETTTKIHGDPRQNEFPAWGALCEIDLEENDTRKARYVGNRCFYDENGDGWSVSVIHWRLLTTDRLGQISGETWREIAEQREQEIRQLRAELASGNAAGETILRLSAEIERMKARVHEVETMKYSELKLKGALDGIIRVAKRRKNELDKIREDLAEMTVSRNQNQTEMNRAMTAESKALYQVQQLTTDRDKFQRQVAEQCGLVEKLKREMRSCAELTGNVIYCREGGGPENVAGTLALSMSALMERHRQVKQERSELRAEVERLKQCDRENTEARMRERNRAAEVEMELERLKKWHHPASVSTEPVTFGERLPDDGQIIEWREPADDSWRACKFYTEEYEEDSSEVEIDAWQWRPAVLPISAEREQAIREDERRRVRIFLDSIPRHQSSTTCWLEQERVYRAIEAAGEMPRDFDATKQPAIQSPDSAAPSAEAIPEGVWWSENFGGQCGFKGPGTDGEGYSEFRKKWYPRRHEFPTSREAAERAASTTEQPNRYLCERCGGTGTQPAGTHWKSEARRYVYHPEPCKCETCNGEGYLGEKKTTEHPQPCESAAVELLRRIREWITGERKHVVSAFVSEIDSVLAAIDAMGSEVKS